MIAASLLISGKDLRLLIFRSGAITQAFLLGLVIVFVFSLSAAPGEKFAPRENAAVFWLSSTFFSIMIFSQLYRLEEDNQSRKGLMLADIPIQSVWLGKSAAGFVLLVLAQLFFLPAVGVFMGQEEISVPGAGISILLLTDAGISALCGLLGAVGHGSASRDSLLSVIIFPFLVPLLMAAISVCSASFGESGIEIGLWIGIASAFDAIFIATALLLFGFLYGGDE